MRVRADVAELLRAGHSNRAIARQLHTDAKDVARAREVLGLPRAKSGYLGAASPEDLFWRRVKPTDDGHMEWTGFRISGTPGMRYGGRNQTAYRIAFRIANGREPEGQALPSCGRQHCVKPGHHEDRADRTARKQQEREARAKARAQAVGTVEDAFRKHAVPVGDGHMEWSGPRDKEGYPVLGHGGRRYSVGRVAFRIANGRKPQGQVKAGCDHRGCVAPDHTTDQPMRRADAMFDQIFGAAA